MHAWFARILGTLGVVLGVLASPVNALAQVYDFSFAGPTISGAGSYTVSGAGGPAQPMVFYSARGTFQFLGGYVYTSTDGEFTIYNDYGTDHKTGILITLPGDQGASVTLADGYAKDANFVTPYRYLSYSYGGVVSYDYTFTYSVTQRMQAVPGPIAGLGFIPLGCLALGLVFASRRRAKA